MSGWAIGRLFLTDPDYRHRCIDRLIEIIFDIDDDKGSMRFFIP